VTPAALVRILPTAGNPAQSAIRMCQAKWGSTIIEMVDEGVLRPIT